MYNQTRKCTTSSSGSPLMKTDLTKGLFQVIVRSRKIRHLITEEEMRGITLCHLEEMSKSLREDSAQVGAMLLHMHQDDLEAELPLFNGEVFCIIKHLSELMDPSIDTGKRFPISFCGLQCLVQEVL
jgi:hypothetical protein